MLNTKRKISILKMLAFFMLVSFAACESKNETKVETTPVVKDTVKKVFDTTAKARPRQPGD